MPSPCVLCPPLTCLGHNIRKPLFGQGEQSFGRIKCRRPIRVNPPRRSATIRLRASKMISTLLLLMPEMPSVQPGRAGGQTKAGVEGQ